MQSFYLRSLMVLMALTWYTKSMSQSRLVYYKDTFSFDYNDDSYLDTLIEEYSYYSGKTIWFINGKNKTRSFINATGDFGSFLAFVRIPEELQQPKQLLDSIESHLFHLYERDQPGHSLSWLLKSLKVEDISDSLSYFRKYSSQAYQWQKTPIQKPSHYRVWVDFDTIIPKRLAPNIKKQGTGWLAYYGGVHQKQWWRKDSVMFKPVFKSKKQTIYKTAHGVLVEKGNQYSWLFHTSRFFSGAPNKLRWHSIDSVVVIDELVFIKQNFRVSNTNNLMVLDLRTGELAWVKLKKLPGINDYYETCFDIQNIEGNIHITAGECKYFGYEGIPQELELSPKYFRNLMQEHRRHKK